MKEVLTKLEEIIKNKVSYDKHSEFGKGYNLACYEILDEIYDLISENFPEDESN